MYRTLDYDAILGYYLESQEWDVELDMFFSDFHIIDITDLQTSKNQAIIISDIYRRFDIRRATCSSDYHFDFHLTPEQFEQIFDRQYRDEQRFSIIFGLWWGLKEPQIKKLMDLSETEHSRTWLNYFICYPDADPDVPFEQIKYKYYRGMWYKCVDGIIVCEMRLGGQESALRNPKPHPAKDSPKIPAHLRLIPISNKNEE